MVIVIWTWKWWLKWKRGPPTYRFKCLVIWMKSAILIVDLSIKCQCSVVRYHLSSSKWKRRGLTKTLDRKSQMYKKGSFHWNCSHALMVEWKRDDISTMRMIDTQQPRMQNATVVECEMSDRSMKELLFRSKLNWVRHSYTIVYFCSFVRRSIQSTLERQTRGCNVYANLFANNTV